MCSSTSGLLETSTYRKFIQTFSAVDIDRIETHVYAYAGTPHRRNDEDHVARTFVHMTCLLHSSYYYSYCSVDNDSNRRVVAVVKVYRCVLYFCKK